LFVVVVVFLVDSISNNTFKDIYIMRMKIVIKLYRVIHPLTIRYRFN